MGKWEKLVKEAYDKWPNNARYKKFVFGLDRLPKIAVLFANLNYQVENGGISQWIDNGYSDLREDLFYALQTLGTELAGQIEEKIKDFWAEYCDDDGMIIEDDQTLPGAEDAADEFDRWYYSINERFVEEVNNFFERSATAV